MRLPHFAMFALLPALAAQTDRPGEQDLPAQFRAIEENQARMPRDRMDPAVVVAECGADPVKLHAWVRDNTRSADYPGALRRALGVLLDRTGNSLDRSLLLAHLLALSGYEARIVGAALAPAPAAVTKPAAPDSERRPLREQAEAITQTVLAKTGALPAVAAADAGVLHFWVQYEDATGWRDLDPTMEAGKRRGEPEGVTFAIGGKKDPAGLDVLAHTVTLRLSVERWEGGKLLESTLLVVPFESNAGPLAAATMTFTPVDKKAMKATQRSFKTGAELHKRLLAESAWSPVLVDGRNGGRMARMFDAAGVVGDLPKSFSGAAEVGNATRNLFGALGGGEEEEPATVLTALCADYLIQVPGRPVRTVRRFVFDSIGPEARSRARSEALPKPKWDEAVKLARGAELAALHDTLVTFASMHSDVYIHRFAQRVLDGKDYTLKAAKGAILDARALEVLANSRSFKTLEFYAAARNDELAPDLIVAEPQVVRRILRYVPNGDTKDLDVDVFSDLAWNRLAPAHGSVPAATLVAQGVLDTLQEAVVVLRDTEARPGDTTAALIAEAVRQGIGIVALKSGQALPADFPGAAKARILADLEAGNLVVVPSRPVLVDEKPRLGWWRIDPQSGHTVGAMDTGLLQDFVEWTETSTVDGIQVTRFMRLRVGRDAHMWANYMTRMRTGGTSWNQWTNLLRIAQQSLNNLGRLPPW